MRNSRGREGEREGEGERRRRRSDGAHIDRKKISEKKTQGRPRPRQLRALPRPDPEEGKQPDDGQDLSARPRQGEARGLPGQDGAGKKKKRFLEFFFERKKKNPEIGKTHPSLFSTNSLPHFLRLSPTSPTRSRTGSSAWPPCPSTASPGGPTFA